MKRLQIISAALRSPSRSTSRTMASSPPAAKISILNNLLLKQWGATNFRYEENPHPMISIRIPGLHHESFDRDRNPKVTSLMQTSSVARWYSLHTPLPTSSDRGEQQQEEEYFLDWPQLTDELFMFMSSSELLFSRALYNRNIQKWPLDMNFSLGNVGNCSVASSSAFYACGDEKDALSKILLWQNTNQFVAVNKTTRKAARLPGWFSDKYKGKGYMGKGLIVKPFDRPAVTFSNPSVVQWTDTDNYGHTNWATYVRWATDALHAVLLLKSGRISYSPYNHGVPPGESPSARAQAAVPSLTHEMVTRGVHKVHITYLKECLQGEYVETHLWQDEGGEEELVNFSVVKNGEDVCQLKMWYFDSLQGDEEEDHPV